MAKRRRRRRAKSRRPRLILIAALGLLIAGFLTRRLLAPRAMRFLTHRSAPAVEHPVIGQHQPPSNAPRETLSDSDRRALDAVAREKSR